MKCSEFCDGSNFYVFSSISTSDKHIRQNGSEVFMWATRCQLQCKQVGLIYCVSLAVAENQSCGPRGPSIHGNGGPVT